MAILDDLADFLAEETTMTVRAAVILLSAEEGLPRIRMGRPGVSHHALFNAPAGRFFCDLDALETRNIFSDIAAGKVEVHEVMRLDPKQQLRIEGNWPSRKIEIDGRYYTVPRNFTRPLADLLNAQESSWRSR